MKFVIILLISATSSCVADLFSSTTTLGDLMKTENMVIEALDSSLKQLKKLQDDLESYKTKFVFHENTTEDYVLKHVSNPINSFTLIKRLYLDLGTLHTIYNQTFEYISSKLFHNEEMLYPEKSDLEGVAILLRDLQVGYSQNITDYTNGYVRGIKYGKPLTAKEVYVLGKTLCETKYKNSCINFLEEALRKWDVSKDIAKIEIMRAISDVYYESQNLTVSLEWDNRILKEEDFDDVATLLHKAQTLQDFKNGFNDTEQQVLKSDDTPPVEYDDNYEDEELTKKFHSTCNEKKTLPEAIKAKLTCFYKYGKNPFLRLAPLKFEQLYLEPEVFLVHQLISDDESEELVKIGQTRLSRSEVILKDGKSGTLNYRISSTAYLYANESLQERVANRGIDITDLANRTLDLQVTHYPPGGFYKPHYDMLLANENKKMFSYGNRVVTVLFYLTDVEQGGGTAFPKLGLMVEPQKGSALYWRNLHTSGEADIRTLHGGCPTLQGIKWVANVWIHMKGHEKATPCGLEYFAEDYNVTSMDRYMEEKSKNYKHS